MPPICNRFQHTMIQIGMNLYLWTTHPGPEHLPLFDELKRCGFGLIEVPASDYSRRELDWLRSALADRGFRITLASILGEAHNPISPDIGVRAAALDKLKADIDQCAALGGEAVIGPLHSAHKRFSGRGPDAAELDRCVQVLSEAADYAAERGIELCIEFLNRFECYFLNTTAQAAALVEAIGKANVGILYDTHHAHLEEIDPAAAITDHVGAINHLHISDSHRGTPGTGNVRWAETFAALTSAGYSGRVVIEAFATDVPAVAEAVNLWRDAFASKEEVYREGIELIRNGFRQQEQV